MLHKEDSPESVKNFNSSKNYPQIKDSYFLEKLNSGLIKYAPDEWTVLSDMEENELK